MVFEAHGEMRTTWINHLLLLEVAGPINKEAADQFNQRIEQSIERRNLPFWVRVERFVGHDDLGTPESLILLQRSLDYCAKHGCKHLVLINPGLLLKDIFELRSARAGLECFTFSTVFDALCFAHTLAPATG